MKGQDEDNEKTKQKILILIFFIATVSTTASTVLSNNIWQTTVEIAATLSILKNNIEAGQYVTSESCTVSVHTVKWSEPFT